MIHGFTVEEYEKAWKEIIGDYHAFFKAVEKIVPLIDEHGKLRSAYDIFQDIAQHVYEVPVVRCRECIHGRFKHQGMYECLHDADIDENTGVPYGFIVYHDPDFFCAYGEKA